MTSTTRRAALLGLVLTVGLATTAASCDSTTASKAQTAQNQLAATEAQRFS